MSTLFASADASLEELKTLNAETLEEPKERLGSPGAARAMYVKLKELDSDGAYNRSLIDGMDDFSPPHDDAELENKGQSDRFNITTGEGPAILSEAVAAYTDIYTTPKTLAVIPLKPEVDQQMAVTWSNILAEEYTMMDRSDDASFPAHLELSKTYVKHGVAVAFFDDKTTMQYSVGGLDHFKFPRKTGIITSKVQMCCALGSYGVTDLFGKIGGDGWNERAIKLAILQSTSNTANKDWNDWEEVQRQIKANEVLVESECDEVEVIHTWVKEFDGKISYYVSARHGLMESENDEEPFLFRARGYYDTIDQALQIFAFAVGNGGRLYTVRGLGYLIFQLCNAMDVLHCKLLDNARAGSSLILQPSSTEDAQDMMLIDTGVAIMLPPGMQMPERQVGINLNNSLIPAINASRQILDRSTGGLAAGNMMLANENDRQTKLEISSKLDYINKLNSFAVNLYYGPYDKVTREKVRRAFSVTQKDPAARKRVEEMKKRCRDRGVPEEVFGQIDFKRVRATRIIGTGSRASRIMLLDQMQQGYATWDAVGRRRFDYDRMLELGGVEYADRYVGLPEEKRIPYDDAIARLENFQLLEGDYLDPQDGQLHMIHIPIHLDELESGLQGVEEGQVDLMEWTMENSMLYKHVVATIEITTVHETAQPELNMYHQRAQQIGEIVTNGLKAINKAVRNGEIQDPNAKQEEGMDEAQQQQKLADQKLQQELTANDLKFKQKIGQEIQLGLVRLENIKKSGQAAIVAQTQKAMAGLVAKDADAQAALQRAKQKQV